MINYKIPTSRYELFCGLFNTKFQIKIHKVDGDKKLLISIQSNEGDSRESISIFAEEVDILANFLQTIKKYVSENSLDK